MFVARFVLLSTLLIGWSLAVPIQLARRGPFPMEVFEAMSDGGKWAVRKLFNELGGTFVPNLDATIDDVRPLVGFTKVQRVKEAQRATILLGHFEDEIRTISSRIDERASTRARGLLEDIAQAKQERSSSSFPSRPHDLQSNSPAVNNAMEVHNVAEHSNDPTKNNLAVLPAQPQLPKVEQPTEGQRHSENQPGKYVMYSAGPAAAAMGGGLGYAAYMRSHSFRRPQSLSRSQ